MDTRISRSKVWFLVAACGYFLFLTVIRNFEVYRQGCLHAHDFALFVEALQKIAGGDLNPFQTTRQLYFLNDHWEPIFILVGWMWIPFQALIDAGRFLLLVDALVIMAAALVLVRKVKGDDRFWILLPFLLFHSDVLAAPRFPVHPSSWAVLPMAYLISFYLEESEANSRVPFWRWAITLLLLSMMNEQFAVVAALLSLVLLYYRRANGFLWWTALSMLMLVHAWFAMKGRPLVLGPIKDYGYYFKPTLGSLVATYRPTLDSAKFWIGFLASGAVLFVALLKNLRAQKVKALIQQPLVFWTVMAGPILAGRFLTGSWHQYYNLPVIFLIGFVFVLLVQKAQLRKSAVVLAVMLPFLGSLDDLSNSARMWATGASNRCFDQYRELSEHGGLGPAAKIRRQFQDEVRALLQIEVLRRDQDCEPKLRVVLADGWIPLFLTEFRDVEFYAPGGSPIQNTDGFDLLVLERGGYGAPFPWTPQRIEEVIQLLKPFAIEIIKDSNEGIIMRGTFKFEVLKDYFIPEKMKSYRSL